MVSWDKILPEFPWLRRATREDNNLLKHFFRPMELTKGLQLWVDRSPDFFSYFDELNTKADVFIAEKEGSVYFSACCQYRQIYWQGTTKQAVYVSDLKISAEAPRVARFKLRKGYQALLTVFPRGTLILTAVFDENQKALQALTRKRAGIIYNPLCAYEAVTCLVLPGINLGNESRKFQIRKIDWPQLPPDLGYADNFEGTPLQKNAKCYELLDQNGDLLWRFMLREPKTRVWKFKFKNKFADFILRKLKVFWPGFANWQHLTPLMALKDRKHFQFSLQALSTAKILKPGSLVVATLQNYNDQSWKYPFQWKNRGTVYSVTLDEESEPLKLTDFLLSPDSL
jgi:hypothetical protein